MTSFFRVVALSCGLTALGWSGEAFATSCDPGVECQDPLPIYLGVFVGAANGTFLVVDILHATRREYLPTGWAITQMAFGTLDLVGGAFTLTYAILSLSEPYPNDAGVFVVAGALVLGGAWFVAHGIVNLIRGQREPPPDLVPIASVTSDGGGVVGVAGRF